MLILGISAYYHDSAACLIKDGKIMAAVEEERFSRIKHDNQFPSRAISFCLKSEKIDPNDISYISYYEKPLLKFERILETFIETWPKSLTPFLRGMPEWLDYKIKVEQKIRRELKYRGKIFFVPHHLSHASACFFPSPYKEAAVLTIDGVGEYQTTGLWMGKNNKIKPLKEINFPNSLGLLYSTFTSFLGFKINEDEYKLMGLSAYGKPKFKTSINQLIKVWRDGSFQLNLKYFSFRESFRMWSDEFERLFGPPKKSDEKMAQRHKDLASSIQAVTEEVYFKILNHLYSLTGSKNLCLSGGVALNALANGKIYKNTPFKNVYVFGAAGDSGAAVGSGLFTYYNVLKHCNARKPVSNLYLGSEYSNDQTETVLKKYNLKYKKFRSEKELIDKTAKILSHGKIVGWFQGRMEFGPRALGRRSILCKPNPRSMKIRMNIIKRREQFRPFAGSILQEKVHEYFEVPEKNHWSPFMTFCFQGRSSAQDKISAIVHKDKSCRVQTVSKINGRYYDLIKKFYLLTGIPCILNTSFNLKGEPIVETPAQAIEDFLKTEMDYLVIKNFIIDRE